MIYHLLTKYHRVCFLKWDFEYSVKYFCHAFQIFLCWNQFRITWQIVIDTQAQLRLSLMSKYPHNYLLNNWLSYKNIQVGTLSQISSEIEQSLALTGSRGVKLIINKQCKSFPSMIENVSLGVLHSFSLSSLTQSNFAFGNRQSIPVCFILVFRPGQNMFFVID